ncbi:MAG: C40 family peptidase [Bacteroidales bacterium]|nr:C40 family peptidase [Bacteroidales bacterium]
MKVSEKRMIAIEIAKQFLGRPYTWGGDDPMRGFDCSGLAVELLKSVGVLPRRGDWTAQMLWNRFDNFGVMVSEPYWGCLVFWKSGGEIIHVEMCLNDELSIGASGGGSKVKTLEDAIKQNAFIKVRPFRSRSGLFGFVDPFLLPRRGA